MTAAWQLAWLGWLGATLAAVGPPQEPPPSPGGPAAGRYLVATRQVVGPVFGESVILLLDASAGGAAGLIVNRPSQLPLRHVFPELEALEGRHDRVHLGGPVEPKGMLFLFRASSAPEDSRRIAGDLHLGQSVSAMRAVLGDGVPAERFRAFLGYAGWAPGQLESEIARGDWFVTEGSADLPFREPADEVWPELMRSLDGIHVRHPPPWHREVSSRHPCDVLRDSCLQHSCSAAAASISDQVRRRTSRGP